MFCGENWRWFDRAALAIYNRGVMSDTNQLIHPPADAWDGFVSHQGGSILQTSRWGELKSAFGWSHEIVTVGDGDTIMAGALVLYRPLPLRLGTIAYVPRGPIVNWNDREAVGRLVVALDDAARRRRAALLKFEPDAKDTPEMRSALGATGFRESPQTVQPPRTILIDIDGTDDEILARMNQGTRRKIKQSAQKGIEIRQGGRGEVESFSRLAQATGRRNEFGVHNLAYYQMAYDRFAPENATLLMASYEGVDVAGLMAFAMGETAWYFYGASSDAERERMPTYGLQWEAIQWARARGCKVYDLWGVPDADEATLEAGFQGRSDGLWGVYGFKRGFGGQVERWVGAWDRVYNRALYAIYRLVMARRAGE